MPNFKTVINYSWKFYNVGVAIILVKQPEIPKREKFVSCLSTCETLIGDIFIFDKQLEIKLIGSKLGTGSSLPCTELLHQTIHLIVHLKSCIINKSVVLNWSV